MKKTIVFLVLALVFGPLLAQSKRLIPAGTAKLTGEDPHVPPPFKAVARFLDLSQINYRLCCNSDKKQNQASLKPVARSETYRPGLKEACTMKRLARKNWAT